MTRSLLALFVVLLPLQALAQTIYKCTDASGGTLISNTPVSERCFPIASRATSAADSDRTLTVTERRKRVTSLPATAQEFSGSGVFVAPGVVLTSNHVVAHCQKVTVGTLKLLASVKVRDAENDLALLSISGLPQNFKVVKLRSNEPRLGESIAAVGYPLRGLLSSDMGISFGSVSATKGPIDALNLFQFSAPVQPGNSGGPILDSHGLLLGIVKGGLNVNKLQSTTGITPQNVNFGVPVQLIRELMKASKVEIQVGVGDFPLEGDALAELARQFSLPVICKKE